MPKQDGNPIALLHLDQRSRYVPHPSGRTSRVALGSPEWGELLSAVQQMKLRGIETPATRAFIEESFDSEQIQGTFLDPNFRMY